MVERIKTRFAPNTIDQRLELDRNVLDVVLKSLYDNSDKTALFLEKEILVPHKFMLPFRESQRVWKVLLSSGLITPTVGFGNAGKVELTRAGYQLMAQYGGYNQYLDSMRDQMQSAQPVIVPISVSSEEEVQQIPPPEKTTQHAAKKKK